MACKERLHTQEKAGITFRNITVLKPFSVVKGC